MFDQTQLVRWANFIVHQVLELQSNSKHAISLSQKPMKNNIFKGLRCGSSQLLHASLFKPRKAELQQSLRPTCS
ncbi:hypothetical protein I7I53_10851 [Histoplasma capsulatum var. duboisii H88]|uniref:Uncharacterized protein n=1 Tax=Ajellomyces capsulatus (strain H88) TaxID=544711 RepID=A0A8A1LCQ3_AJEC8|nr:hypothetical protein I7I53_10851 [Histoplasma capsulatum var. duboisii H88]